jgi:hypothetical protein
MKVGDLVREIGLQERTGVIIEGTFTNRYDGARVKLYKVLWNRLSPTLPTLVGPAWRNQLEVINESR